MARRPRYLLWFVLLAVGVLVSPAMGPATARESQQCFEGSKIRLSLSGQEFLVPIGLGVQITTKDRKSFQAYNSETNSQCRNRLLPVITQPIHAYRFFLQRTVKSAELEERTPGLSPVSLLVGARFTAADQKRRLLEDLTLKRFRERAAQQGIPIASLPQFAGFYAIREETERHRYFGPFMAVPGGALTPGGVPLVVGCSSGPIVPTAFKHLGSIGAYCRIEYDWTSRFYIMYRFSGNYYHIDDWVVLDQSVREFVSGMMVPASQ